MKVGVQVNALPLSFLTHTMKIVLISCAAKKAKLRQGEKIAAKDLYTSPMFKMAWEYATKLKPDRIYILSAKHGLVNPQQKLEHYNQTLNDASTAERRRWAEDVLKSLQREGVNLNKDQVTILAGNSYSQYIVPHIKNCSLPYKENGCTGMGYILKFLKNEISKRS